jgi:aarF domain-containing kinase
MLVRPHPRNPALPQIVLLDHGLYRNLEPDFREHYTRLWCGIICGDVKAIKKHCSAMGAEELYPLMAAMLTKKPWDDIISTQTER